MLETIENAIYNAIHPESDRISDNINYGHHADTLYQAGRLVGMLTKLGVDEYTFTIPMTPHPTPWHWLGANEEMTVRMRPRTVCDDLDSPPILELEFAGTRGEFLLEINTVDFTSTIRSPHPLSSLVKLLRSDRAEQMVDMNANKDPAGFFANLHSQTYRGLLRDTVDWMSELHPLSNPLGSSKNALPEWLGTPPVTPLHRSEISRKTEDREWTTSITHRERLTAHPLMLSPQLGWMYFSLGVKQFESASTLAEKTGSSLRGIKRLLGGESVAQSTLEKVLSVVQEPPRL